MAWLSSLRVLPVQLPRTGAQRAITVWKYLISEEILQILNLLLQTVYMDSE